MLRVEVMQLMNVFFKPRTVATDANLTNILTMSPIVAMAIRIANNPSMDTGE